MNPPAGRYVAKISTWDLTKASSGNPMLVVEFNSVGHPGVNGDVLPLKDNIAPFSGLVRVVFSISKETSLAWAFKKLTLLGFTGEDLRRLHPAAPNAHDFTDTQFILEVKEDDFIDKKNVTHIRPSYDIAVPQSKGNPIDKQAVADLDKYSQEFKAWQDRKGKSITPEEAAALPF